MKTSLTIISTKIVSALLHFEKNVPDEDFNLSCIQTDTVEEREVVLKALRQCENLYSRYYLNEALEDVRFDFQLRDDIVIGSPFK